MEVKYFRVEAKMGHHKKGYYSVGNLFIMAENGKDAAQKARYTPRVKHDDKYAILDVEEVSYSDYCIGVIQMNQNPYFKCNNIQEQRAKGIEFELYKCSGYDERRKLYRPKRRYMPMDREDTKTKYIKRVLIAECVAQMLDREAKEFAVSKWSYV